MRFREILNNGGWASAKTQSTRIGPQLVAKIMPLLQQKFIPALNKFLAIKNIPPAEISAPGGSATYYKRDLVSYPTKEYGDVDVQCHIAKIDGMNNNQNSAVYQQAIKEFCEKTSMFSTDNGTNVILHLGEDVVQVDLIFTYYENKGWVKTLAPEYQVKGVLCNSLYTSMGEALQLSFGGGHGVQAKTQGGQLVPFRTIKDVELQTITNNPDTWAVDICKYFGCTKLSPILKNYPGTLDEVRTADIAQSFKGIAQSLEMSGKGNARELLDNVRQIYLGKINKAINSSKFDKAQSPEAIAKAEATKQTLAKKSAEIAKLL